MLNQKEEIEWELKKEESVFQKIMESQIKKIQGMDTPMEMLETLSSKTDHNLDEK